MGRSNDIIYKYLRENEDYTIDEKTRDITLTDGGTAKAERYFRIENLLYANKREMRSLPKDSNELKLKKQQIKIMKSKMEEIDNKYFELTNKYIYQG